MNKNKRNLNPAAKHMMGLLILAATCSQSFAAPAKGQVSLGFHTIVVEAADMGKKHITFLEGGVSRTLKITKAAIYWNSTSLTKGELNQMFYDQAPGKTYYVFVEYNKDVNKCSMIWTGPAMATYKTKGLKQEGRASLVYENTIRIAGDWGYKVDAGTEVRREGKTAKFYEVRPGDYAFITAKQGATVPTAARILAYAKKPIRPPVEETGKTAPGAKEKLGGGVSTANPPKIIKKPRRGGGSPKGGKGGTPAKGGGK